MSGWRVVMVSSRAKLELHLNYLVVKASEFTKRIHIDEINTLISLFPKQIFANIEIK